MSGLAPFIPAIQAGVGLYGVAKNIGDSIQAKQKMATLAQQYQPLGYDAALKQANDALGAQWDSQIKQGMANSTKDLIFRGMYGQLPGAALDLERLYGMQKDKFSAMAQMAQNLVQQSKQNALQAQGLGMSYSANMTNQFNQMVPQNWSMFEGMKTMFDRQGSQYPGLKLDDIVIGVKGYNSALGQGYTQPSTPATLTFNLDNFKWQ